MALDRPGVVGDHGSLPHRAIARGPLSVVIPAVLGFVFLNEPVSVSKILGLIFACLAVVLLTQ